MSLVNDIRLAVRLLINDRKVTAVAAMALALGIAANSTVFTLVNAVILRGVPFPDADRIVVLGTRDTQNRNMGVSYYDFLDWQAASRSFSDMCLMARPPFNVSEEGRAPERYNGAYVSGSLFRLIGEEAILGRRFVPDDDKEGAPPVVVLGYNIWQTRYGGDRVVIGKTIKVNDLATTVVGVMPAGMQFPPNTDLWLPMTHATVTRAQSRQVRVYEVIARLADGVTIQQARAELQSITGRLARDFPQTNKDIQPTINLYNETINGSQIGLIFWSLMGAVGFVLLIACANVANLLLARAADRAKEMGVRVSLGASRLRIVRQLLVESVLLALLGGVLGLPLAFAGVRAFDGMTQDVGKPYYMEFTIDAMVFVFFFAICLITGIAFGLAPALHVSKTNLNEVLKEGGRSGSSGVRAQRWTNGLLVVQVALTLTLLAGAGFMMRSFFALYRLDLGIDTSRLLTMQLILNNRKYAAPEQRDGFVRRLDERLAGVSAFEAVTTTSNLPLGGGMGLQLAIDGRTDSNARPPIVTVLSVGSRYFDALKLPILRGRTFTGSDDAKGRTGAIVNQRFADIHFRDQDPLGRHISLTEEAANGINLQNLTIVGVTRNVRQRGMEAIEPDPIVYVPYLATSTLGSVSIIIRTPSSAAAVTPLARQAVFELDSEIPLFNVRPMDEVLARQRWPFRVFGGMFAVFAGIALTLAAVGLYAVMAYSVTQRTQEIGVRMVLGAPPRDVVWLFLRRAIVLVIAGLTLGLAGAFGVGQLLRSLLIQTSTRDALVLVSVAFIMAIVAVIACVWPARRATRLNPVTALRYE